MKIGRGVLWAVSLLAGLHLALAAPPDGGVRDGSVSPPSKEKPSDPEVVRTFVPKGLPPLPVLGEHDGVGQTVVVIPIGGTIDQGLAPYVKRCLETASQRGAKAVILNVDTFGGRVDAAVIIRDAVLAAPIPVIAYVNRRAISAGALISYAADFIAFAPGSSMGAATPVQIQGGQMEEVGEKVVSYMRSEMRATAEANGRNGDVAEAMVDRSITIEGVSEHNKLLTVTTDQALKFDIANAQVDSLDALLIQLGLSKATRVEPQVTWAEKLARFLTDPVVSGMLMSIGMLGLLIEFYTPGFGFAGALGLLCLLLFFSGHLIVDLAGWEEVILFVVGLVLLGVEIFVIPGFGVVGALGIAAIVGSLVLALLGMPVSTAWELGAVGGALGKVMLSMAGTVVAALILARYIPKSRVGRSLVLQTTLGSAHAIAEAPPPTSGFSGYVGRTGIAVTDLRLSGKASLGDELLDVVSQHEYLDKGTPIRVVEVEGARIVVIRERARTEGDSHA